MLSIIKSEKMFGQKNKLAFSQKVNNMDPFSDFSGDDLVKLCRKRAWSSHLQVYKQVGVALTLSREMLLSNGIKKGHSPMRKWIGHC